MSLAVRAECGACPDKRCLRREQPFFSSFPAEKWIVRLSGQAKTRNEGESGFFNAARVVTP